MRGTLLLIILICSITIVTAQNKKTENVIIVTMDGMRWQEIFSGADSLLTFDTAARYDTGYIRERFWASSAEERRKKLTPFLWSEVATQGVLFGNRNYGSLVNNANRYWFSYPGYNEIFTGYPDTAVNSNKKVLNQNENVLEYLNKQPAFKNKTAVFGSWDVFSYIFNEGRSGFLVNDGFEDLGGKLTERQKVFNEIQHQLPDLFHGDERLDAATFNMAFEYIKSKKPKLLFLGLGDADEFAHEGQYDYYLDAANHFDAWLKQLWEYIQSTPGYANKTTLIITTDHGRGYSAGGNWKSHNSKFPGSSEMWMAFLGPSIQPVGESHQKQQIYQGQLAATIAALLGKEFKPAHSVLPALPLP
jgi:hypothetical protein